MSRRQSVPEDVANKIWDILVEHAGCYKPSHPLDDLSRMGFVRTAHEGTWSEFRFGGSLGFGGKLWDNRGRWYVNCYPEDSTPERKETIARTNVALDKLFEETYGEPPQPW